MNLYGIDVKLKNTPELDPDFFPLHRFNEAFLVGAEKPIGIAVERTDGQMASVRTRIRDDGQRPHAARPNLLAPTRPVALR